MSPRNSGIMSARPQMTADIAFQTGLNEAVLSELVHNFYGKVRTDPVLGPIFESRVEDWDAHLLRMIDFWSSVALMTGRYHGAPVPAHAELPIEWKHFERWLTLFSAAAAETCTPEGTRHVVKRARQIAGSLHRTIERRAASNCATPGL